MEENKVTSDTNLSDPTPISAPPPVAVSSTAPTSLPDNNPPIPAPAITPDQTPPPVTGKKSNSKKIILIAVAILVLIALAGGAILVTPMLLNQPQPTLAPTPVPTPEIVLPKPDEMSGIINSIAIGENTVSAAKTGGQYFLNYKDQYYEPRDLTSDNQELEAIDLKNPESYTWHGLIDIPETEVFDFAQLPEINPGFAFIMYHPGDDQDRYSLYYFAYDELSPIGDFDINPSQLAYRIPKFYSINSAGTLGALHMYDCWDCERHYPQTLVVNFISKEMQVLGPTSYFAWGTDENFEYKDYVPGVDPATLPLKQGSFKFGSTSVATPRPSATGTPRPSATPAAQ